MKIEINTKFNVGDHVRVTRFGSKNFLRDAWGYRTWVGTDFIITTLELRHRVPPSQYKNDLTFPFIKYWGMVNGHDEFSFDEYQLDLIQKGEME